MCLERLLKELKDLEVGGRVETIQTTTLRTARILRRVLETCCHSDSIYLMRWLTNFYDFTFKWTATAAIGIHLLKPDYHSWWISKMQSGCEDTLEEWYAIKFCFKLGKNATEMYGMLQTAFRQWIEHKFLSGIRDSRKAGSLRDDERCGRSKEVNTPELIGQRVRIRVTMLRF